MHIRHYLDAANLASTLAILAAISAWSSARQSLKANKISILPILSIRFEESTTDLRNSEFILENIGVGVAHNIHIPPVMTYTNLRTPNRRHYVIGFSNPLKNYLKPSDTQTLICTAKSIAWYMVKSHEDMTMIPIYFEDSLGTSYVSIMLLGNGRADIKHAPVVLNRYLRIKYWLQFNVGGFLKFQKFNNAPNDPNLKTS